MVRPGHLDPVAGGGLQAVDVGVGDGSGHQRQGPVRGQPQNGAHGRFARGEAGRIGAHGRGEHLVVGHTGLDQDPTAPLAPTHQPRRPGQQDE